MNLSVLVTVACLGTLSTAGDIGPIRTERKLIPGGAEVITYFQQIPSADGATSELPLLAVLNDSLGNNDPATDRLREVWVFTYRSPGWSRRLAGAVPFLYAKAPLPEGRASRPSPVIDMASPTRGMWKDVAAAVAQNQMLNPLGTVVHLASRSYVGNMSEYRRTHVWQALDVLAVSPVTGDAGLTEQQMRDIQGRLELSNRVLGGLVPDEYLDRAFLKSHTRQMEDRAANWDLLRQKAEENGLYFQPVSLAGLPESWAILWLDQNDIGSEREFDSQFLNISDPFRDGSLKKWKGYSENRSIEDAGGSGGREVRMIPLALYSLDHPRAPLLLVDMRNAGGPKRSELMRRFVGDAATGFVGLTGYGTWGYLALKSTYSFVRGRHGVPVDRSARLRAYVQVQHALAADRSLPPALRNEFAKRVDSLEINPLEHDWNREVLSARQQYAAFLHYVDSPGGLVRDLEADRRRDGFRATHSAGERTLMRVATIATLGIYRHHENVSESELAQIENRRRDLVSKRRETILPPESPTIFAGGSAPGGDTAQ